MKNIFIISGPAGSGKDSVIEALTPLLPFKRVITTTTRSPRPGESEGYPYHFVTRAEFETKLANSNFIEHSVNENGEAYGVTRDEIERAESESNLTLWKVDWKGVVNAKKLFPEIKAILITAPLEILESRLRRRDGEHENEHYFEERMKYTREWMKHIDIYDYIVENEEGKLEETVEKVRTILGANLAHPTPQL